MSSSALYLYSCVRDETFDEPNPCTTDGLVGAYAVDDAAEVLIGNPETSDFVVVYCDCTGVGI